MAEKSKAKETAAPANGATESSAAAEAGEAVVQEEKAADAATV